MSLVNELLPQDVGGTVLLKIPFVNISIWHLTLSSSVLQVYLANIFSITKPEDSIMASIMALEAHATRHFRKKRSG